MPSSDSLKRNSAAEDTRPAFLINKLAAAGKDLSAFATLMPTMTTPAHQSSSVAPIFCYIVIAISAAFLLSPTVRALPFAKVAISLVLLADLAVSVFYGMRSGAMKKSIPALVGDAKSGRFVPVALETAAGIVVCIAFWMTI